MAVDFARGKFSMSRSGRRRLLTSLVWVAPLSVLLAAFITWTIVTVGPEPDDAAGSEWFESGRNFGPLVETRDRLVLAGWWLAVPALLASLALAQRRQWHRAQVVGQVGVVVAVGLVLFGLLRREGTGGWVPHLSVAQLAGGAVLVAVSSVAAVGPTRLVRRVAAAMLLLTLVVVAAPALVQFRGGFVEPGHAGFTLDELLAPAAGRIPMVNYVAQYTNLLGYPIVPWVRLAPDQALTIALVWVFVLQIVAIAGAVFVATLAGGRRWAIPALGYVVAPLVFAAPNRVYVAGYFASFPYRTVLPIVAIAAAVAWFGRGVPVERSLLWRAAVVGGLAGIAALNNPEYGVPALLAIGGTVLLSLPTRDARLRATAGGTGGVLVPFAAYGLFTAVTGDAARWSDYLYFSRIFGSLGYGNLAMPAFGMHVIVVALFVSATATGLLLLFRAADARRRTQGFALAVTGGWGVLTLPYYMGRSHPAQVFVGYAFTVGLVAAVAAPLVVEFARRLVAGRVTPSVPAIGSLAMAFLLLSATMAGLTGAWTPATSWTRLTIDQPDPWSGDSEQLESALRQPGNADLQLQLVQGHLGQWVRMASLAELRTGVANSSLFNNTAFYSGDLKPVLADQCSRGEEPSITTVVMTEAIAAKLALVPECRAVFMTDQVRVLLPTSAGDAQTEGEPVLVAVPVRQADRASQ